MNATATITFDILDYWHAGAGHGAGRYFDAVVVRTPAGLPYLPGRTVKGLVRDAVKQCEEFGHLAAGTTELLFGSAVDTGRFDTEAGRLQFGNAELDGAWEAYAASAQGRPIVPGFYDSIASTALDENGQAKDAHLRRVEVAIPLALTARWQVVDPEHFETARHALELALPLLRSLGTSRHRGLGRVQAALRLDAARLDTPRAKEQNA